MRGSARWTLVCAALAALLVVAFATQLGGTGKPAGGDGRPGVQSAPDAHGTEQALADILMAVLAGTVSEKPPPARYRPLLLPGLLVVGVPLSTPAVLNVTPAGSVPAVTTQV